MKKEKLLKILRWIVIIGAGVIMLIQLVPYGRDHTNPPILREPDWDSPITREIAVRSCFNCHSNESEWPWYSFVAPSSWLLQYDVDTARRNINFSEWEDIGSRYLVEVVESGRMPPFRYWIVHPEAKLSEQEKALFIQGLQATLDK